MTDTAAQAPGTARTLETIDLAALTKHPNNVRRDLKITESFRESVLAKLDTPLLVTPLDDGGYRVVDGHRRLIVYIDAERTSIECIIDLDADEAGQYVTMAVTAEQREALTTAETTAALFSAAELGADVKAMADRMGWTQKAVKAAVKVGGSKTVQEAVEKAESGYEFTLDQLDALHEFENDPAALEELVDSVCDEDGDDMFDYTLRRLRNQRAEQQRLAEEREALVKAGVRVLDAYSDLPDTAVRTMLLRDEAGDQVEDHVACPGHLAAPREWNENWTTYCEDPRQYGHQVPVASTGTSGSTTSTSSKPDPQVRARVVAGNQHWVAASDTRRDWVKQFAARGSWPREAQEVMGRFVATAFLSGGWTVSNGLFSRELLVTWLGQSEGSGSEEFAALVARSDKKKLPVFAFIAAATTYEHHAGAKDKRAWRTDSQGYTGGLREQIGRYLAVLEQLGMPLSPAERAVKDGLPYDPLGGALQPTVDSDAAEETRASLDLEEAGDGPDDSSDDQ